MAKLSIHLQEGFDNDLVVIKVNGKGKFRNTQVTTKLLLGYAEVVELLVSETAAKVQISLPQKKLTQAVNIPLSADAHIAVSIVDNQIAYQVSDQPFGYM
jgi:hypothetical protein